MKEEKSKFVIWVKEHRKQLIAVGFSVTVIVGICLGIKHKEKLVGFWHYLKESVDSYFGNSARVSEKLIQYMPSSFVEIETVSPCIKEPTYVCGHIRNLPNGKHHSAEKAAQAVAMKVDLLPNQTFVDPYIKYAA